MLFNLRAKCINNNGAAAIYTWRNIECDNEQHAHEVAKAWGEANDKQFKNPDAELAFQLKCVETSLPSNEEVQKEHDDYIREKVEFELFCGGYNDEI